MTKNLLRTKIGGIFTGLLALSLTNCAPARYGQSNIASESGPERMSQAVTAASGPTDVLTNRYNNARTGVNLNESQLHTGNVNVNQFGKLFARAVEGQVYAQPLVVSNLALSDGSTRNVVFVATMHNFVYAFDADDPNASNPLWKVSMGPSFPFTDYGQSNDITDQVGVLATPVIDRSTNTMYVVAATKENNIFYYKLHALDIRTGQEKLNGPVTITGSVRGTTWDAVNGVITFNPKQHLQRPGLLLTQGKIVFAFASHFDQQPYHGWVFAYDAQSLAQTGIAMTSPDSQGSGLWQAGSGLSTDEAGNVYGVTGNGFGADATTDFNRTESVVKWSLPTLALQDWFTPANWQHLDDVDDDLGCDGPMMLPGTNYVLTGSKGGIVYVMDRNNMGRLQANDAGVHQEFRADYSGGSMHIHGTPIYFNGPQGGWLYVWGENDYLRAFALKSDGYFTTQNVSQSPMKAVQNSMPGGITAISSSGNTPGTGILWANLVTSGDANTGDRPGTLRAFDASDLSRELWNSEMNPTRDRLGTFAKFNQPTIANGKVYMATFSNQLVVYGLLPGQPATNPIIAPLQPKPISAPGGDLQIISKSGNYCLSSASAADGTHYQIVACSSTDNNQKFQFNLTGEIKFGGECSDAFGGLGLNGDIVGTWACNGGINQKWNLMDNGEIRGINGKCLTANSASAGSELSIQDCAGLSTQKWTVTTFGSTNTTTTTTLTTTTTTVTTTTTTTTTVPTNNWTFCSNEYQYCSFTGTMQVRYGLGDTWVVKTLTNGTSCSNDVFGDPLFGVTKQCQIAALSSSTTGDYFIKTRLNNTYCADSPDGNTNTQLHLWQCIVGNINQDMTFTAAGEIRVHGKCVGASGTSSGASAVNQDCNGSASQKWTYNASTGELKGLNGMCLDLYGSYVVNGNNLYVYNCHGGTNQKWDLSAYGSTSTTTTTTTVTTTTTTTTLPSTGWTYCATEGSFCSFSGTMQVRYGSGNTWVVKTLTNGTNCSNDVFGDPLFGTTKQCQIAATSTTGDFFVKTHLDNAYCADSPDGNNGTQIHLWQCIAGNFNQDMSFTAAGEIRVHGKCLGASSSVSGAAVVNQDCNGSANQKWTYNASTRELKGLNGMCLDLYGWNVVNGNNIFVYNCHGGTNQQWDLSAYK